MAYGAAAGTNYEGLSIASLPPGIYEGYELKEVKFERTTKSDGTQGKEILTFLYDGPSGPHQHTEYAVDTTDAKKASKEANCFKRIAHTCTKFVPKANVDQAGATGFADFAALANWTVATLTPQVRQGVKVNIKVLGNVYNGEARASFPGYPPFIARPGYPDYKALVFSSSENADNAAYANHLNATPDKEQSTASSSNTAGVKVDSDF